MSLRLYLDDCANSRELHRRLIEAGHDVETPGNVRPSLAGADDSAHFLHARATGRVILTLNARDFEVLHDRGPGHAGIFAVYQDNNPAKDMSYRDIVQAIANLESIGAPIAGAFWVLNAYRW